MKELLRKKYIKILLSLITLLVVMGTIGINVQSNQKSKEYEAHIEAAEKYLSDLDYEQAIAEYTKALEIDPKEEVVDALAQAYLDYAKSYADTGDYEKAASILEESYEKINPKEEIVDALEQAYLAYAQTYIEAEDYEKAVSILKEKSERTGWESLQNMIVEVTALQEQKKLEEEKKRLEEEKRESGMVKFPFQLSEITVMGYDLFEDHFAQIQEPFPIDWVYEDGSGGAGATPDGKSYRIETDYRDWGEFKWLTVDAENNMGNWRYGVAYGTNGTISRSLYLSTNFEGDVFNDPLISVPVTAGESYKDWCRVMQVERIKENDLRPEIRDGEISVWRIGVEEGSEYWLFYTEEYQGLYEEHSYEGGGIECTVLFSRTNSRTREEQFPSMIQVSMTSDGAIFGIGYQDSHKW